MSVEWNSLPEAVRLALEAAGIYPGTVVYIRKSESTPTARLAEEFAELQAEGLGTGAALERLARRYRRHQRTIRRHLRMARSKGGAR